MTMVKFTIALLLQAVVCQNTSEPVGSGGAPTTGSSIAPDNPNNEPVENQYLGNCLSQIINFNDTSRIFAMDGLDVMRDIIQLDAGRYDMTIDYFKDKVKFVPEGVELSLSKAVGDGPPPAPRLSTTRFIRYGKYSAVFKAPAVRGIVTTFISMGPHLPDKDIDLTNTDPRSGDEIDWEILGYEPNNAQSNIFYRGFKEFELRNEKHEIDDITKFHKYTIDWRRNKIVFSIDDVVVREYLKDGSQADSKEAPSRRFFPDRAQKIQFALWSEKDNNWSGGAPQFPEGQDSATAVYRSVEIQCYDNQDQPVPQWPISDKNPPYKATIKNQPTAGINGKIPITAGPNFKGEIKPDGTPAKKNNGDNGNSIRSKANLAMSLVFFIILLW